MKNFKVWALAVCLATVMPSLAQQTKRNLTVEDLVSWQRITQKEISDNGEWVACKMEPWRGDATVYLYGKKGEEITSFATADQFQFSASSAFLVVSQKPALCEVESLKLKKTKKENMTMNRLVIYTLKGTNEVIDSIKTYKMAEEADWLAYQCGKKDSSLHVRSLDGKIRYDYPHVSDYGFAPKSSMLYYVSKDAKNKLKGLYVLNPVTGQSFLLKEGKGVFSKMTFNEPGDKLAFLYADSKKTAYKASQLWLAENQETARPLVTATHAAMPQGWVVSEHSRLYFSKSSARLFFGTSPEPRQKDTLQLAENRPTVQIWSWDEPVQYTVQEYNKEKNLKKSYTAVYLLPADKVIQLGTEKQPDVAVANEGDGPWALASTSRPYSRSSMWEGRTRRDYFTVSLEDGAHMSLTQADYGRYRMSPKGNYAYWYAETDSCWYTISLADRKRHRLTTPDTFIAWDEQNDVPDYPEAYGCAGWADNDQYLYIYDRYDIWRFDPKGKEKPVNLTKNGRDTQMIYRIIQLDPEARTLDVQHTQLLKGVNEVSKGEGYYQMRLNKPSAPKEIMAGNYALQSIHKAKNADKVIFTKETYEMYPDIHYCSMNFKKPVQLTSGYKQQEKFLWGTAEMVSWKSLDGIELQGIVYKPADFDPTKKYPMVVNFYERNSDRFYFFRMPEAHRSTVDYHMYNSNGYLIFNPDIRYKDGHPGESCYNCLMPGIQMLIDKGFVDEHAIGAQGHSWGGYQVAYLSTRTQLFAAIESGAPVVNMFSAYGGIRWGSGMARSFQYEHTQSRLGTTPWEGPEIYKENSPLFTLDKIGTPILIMHNDHDGHVPWYQGIEFFVGMKRLSKPCWLLNYTTEIHWPLRLANRMDFQRRMQQFFNHYLKKEPMPKWMKEGVKAVEQPFELGYEKSK